MRPRTFEKIGLFVVASLLFVGCASIGVRQPRVSLVDVRFGDVRLLETTLQATLRIENDGETPLRLSGAAHRIYLNGVDVGRGLSDESVVVPRLGSATQDVEIYVSNISLLSKLESIIASQVFSYRIESTLYTGGFFGLGSYRTTSEGRFDFAGQGRSNRGLVNASRY